MLDNLPVGLGVLASAEVGQSPCGVSDHGELLGVCGNVDERLESVALENVISALRGVTGNVTESPHGLLSHIGLGRVQEVHKQRHSSGINHNLGLFAGTGSDVGQSPCGLELQQVMGDLRNSTKYLTTSHWITSLMGGDRSLESSFRNLVVASSWASRLLL